MKRLFSVLLVFVLAFSLFGCGEGETTPATSEVPTVAPTEVPTPTPISLEDRFKAYPALMNVDGWNGLGYYNSIDELTTARVFTWTIEHIDPCNFTDDNGGYSYSYKITDLDAFTEKYLGRTYDYLPITNEDLVLDPESDTLTITYHGAYGDMPVRAVYASYMQIGDTLFEITYHTGTQDYVNNTTEFWKTTRRITVELVDGNYIVTAHQEGTKMGITQEEYYDWYIN